MPLLPGVEVTVGEEVSVGEDPPVAVVGVEESVGVVPVAVLVGVVVFDDPGTSSTVAPAETRAGVKGVQPLTEVSSKLSVASVPLPQEEKTRVCPSSVAIGPLGPIVQTILSARLAKRLEEIPITEMGEPRETRP